jgi:nucleotide-binding universal stress UspA family protein
MEIKKILWPTDFSENSASALPYVESLTEKYETEIHLLYVIDDMAPNRPWYGDVQRASIDKLHEWEGKTARERLDKLCTDYLKGCPRYVTHIASGDPAQEILKFLENEKVDMVVMAKHGEKGHFRLGSVSERIVKNAPVPVVTIPIGSE